ncbi:AAA family ATPase [Chryseobacterium luteum]|nr:AAA family ATPase [Chryseobacterium luteum]
MIKEIVIKNLYGVFTHKIKTKKNNITLILGENGIGKTVILKLIKSLFDNNFYELGKHDFEIFSVYLENNSLIEVKKKSSNKALNHFRPENYSLEITYYENSKSKKTGNSHFKLSSDTIYEFYKSGNEPRNRRFLNPDLFYTLKNYLPIPIDRVSSNRIIDLNSGRIYGIHELIDRFAEYLPNDIKEVFSNESIPEWFTLKIKSYKVKLIETQRLLTKIKSDDQEYKNAVTQSTEELKSILRTKTLEATNLSTKLDRTYTNRLIEKVRLRNNSSINDIEDSLIKLEDRRNFLINVGLLENDNEAINSISDINNNTDDIELLKDVLEVYIDDSNAKLKTYDDLSEKLNSLIEIINKRFNYKNFSINKNEGFLFKSDITGKRIPLTNLSSGEQHELVLFYELLFNTPSNSTILIDEPEISLHISWQNEFINDLKEIISINNISAIVATHSPDIINGNWDLTVELSR